MNILYIAPFATPSFIARVRDQSSSGLGGSRKVGLIMKALAQLGHRFVLLSSIMTSNSRFTWRSEVREILDLEEQPATIIYPGALTLRPLGGLINSFRSIALIRHLLQEFVPDVAIIYNTYLFESLAARELKRIKRIPILLEVEDLPLARRRGALNIKPLLDQRCWKFMLELASGFTAVNKPILDMLPSDKPKYLLPGVIDEQLVVRYRKRLEPFSTTERTLGYFGSLTEDKGVVALLRLVPRLPPPWHLVITGSGPLSSAFKMMSTQHPGKLTFLGSLNQIQLYDAMCKCDCTVIPVERITDGGKGVFPFKTLEYLIAGTHVIAPPLPQLKDLGLSFIQRWDGAVDSLLAALSRAEIEFLKEKPIREQIIASTLSRFGLTGVGCLFSNLLSRIADQNQAGLENV